VFSIAYIDIDNFKHINDTFGHASGDEVLNIVAETLRTNLRNVDVVARLGGDEFVVLLPETDSKEVKEAFRHAHRNLVEGFAKHSMPITFSIGVVSFDSCPESFKQAVQVADETMYSVKRKVKNNIVYQVWDGLEHKPMQ
jgi:diguanylate cyclase (GGDEF)-like protein